ncbi:ATP-dependent DNA ligase [Guyanagaster necrorhizus]|uniref:DNA ligase n=1 Tax=Guyanagaster necrorhizus TaxID=856835 RepID=A0A9P7W478_9AGAR|nr:ATP-dependent DNA ligase [Guyanagaster necrorhizus MCA 3950]KAG7452353.1 ATP-dependent DNA ligase [Guyanagaster necrorhizus MCA 3950]
MSKRRPPLASPGTKRRKVADQTQIDSFFSPQKSTLNLSKSLASPSVKRGSQSSIPKSNKGSSSQSETSSTAREVVDVDSWDSGFPGVLGPIHDSLPVTKPSSDPSLFFPPNHIGTTKNSSVPYAFLANTLSEVARTRSRISIINSLTNAFRIILMHDPISLLPAIYLLSNTLSPPYIQTELGLGPSTISQSIQHVSGLPSSALRKLYNKTGDPGDVAVEAKSNMRTLLPHPPLLVPYVYEALLKISKSKGQGASKQRQSIAEKLLVSAKGEETRFLVRTLCQNLRVGAVRTSILTALARAIVLTPLDSQLKFAIPEHSTWYATKTLLDAACPVMEGKSNSARDVLYGKFKNAETLIRQIFCQHPNYDHIIKGLFEVRLDGLAEKVPLAVGVPLYPNLGSPIRSLDEIYERLGDLPFTAEFKYDGQRAQIHAWKPTDDVVKVSIFSRHLEDMSSKYPDVVALVERMLLSSKAQNFIMDSEIVAIDPSDGSLRTFQELSTRARKDVNLSDVQVPVCVFGFDLMYLDGKKLLETDFRHRRALLQTRFSPLNMGTKERTRFDHVERCESVDGRLAVEAFWAKAIDSRSEGLMIKLLDTEIPEYTPDKETGSNKKPLFATYNADKRTYAWMKLKKDYVMEGGVSDSLDLIPIGAWNGNGRKAKFWSPILLAMWNPSSGRATAVCKCMSGFSDTFYKDVTDRYTLTEDSDVCSQKPLWDCELGGFRPDVYFKPQEVWEIRGADITISPVSIAAKGLVSSTKGLSLRFPRFIKIREDKGISQASTPQFLADMYTSQQGRSGRKGGHDEGDLVDIDVSCSGAEEEDEGEEEEG